MVADLIMLAESSNRVRSPRVKAVCKVVHAYHHCNQQCRIPVQWRKYGQKVLRNKSLRGLVRCYYKCYYPGCPAKKLVEKNSSDLDKIIHTKYEMEHVHPVAQEDYED